MGPDFAKPGDRIGFSAAAFWLAGVESRGHSLSE